MCSDLLEEAAAFIGATRWLLMSPWRMTAWFHQVLRRKWTKFRVGESPRSGLFVQFRRPIHQQFEIMRLGPRRGCIYQKQPFGRHVVPAGGEVANRHLEQ